MKKIILDFKVLKTKTDLHTYLQKELGFDRDYGHNLDALYDLLTLYQDKVSFQMLNLDHVEIDLKMYIDDLKLCLIDAEKINQNITVL